MVRVLIVDDEPDILASLRELMDGIGGCEVQTAASFAEGSERLGEGGWDVVLSDERLPDGRGADLLARAAEEAPGSLRVLMSAWRVQALVDGETIHRFISKPFTMRQVHALLTPASAPGLQGGNDGSRSSLA